MPRRDWKRLYQEATEQNEKLANELAISHRTHKTIVAYMQSKLVHSNKIVTELFAANMELLEKSHPGTSTAIESMVLMMTEMLSK